MMRPRLIPCGAFPLLQRVSVHLSPDAVIFEVHALALYSQGVAYIDPSELSAAERRFIARLIREYGERVHVQD